MLSLLLWSSLFTVSSQVTCPDDTGASLCGPENVNVSFDVKSWTIFTTWDDAASSGTNEGLIYDVEVLYTDDLKKLHTEAIKVRSDQTGTQHLWSWRSPLPFECTTHAVRLRSRHLNKTSQWSPLQINPGKTVLSEPAMVPMDTFVEVGHNLTLCCVTMGEEPVMKFNGTRVVTRIGNHSYTITVHIQEPLPLCTISAVCKTGTYGTCVYAGYPPDDRQLKCETRDLERVECHWNIGRPTQLIKRGSTTSYKLNGRSCPQNTTSNCIQTVDVGQGEVTWMLEAQNPLGIVKIKETADLMRRVRMLAPVNVVASEVNDRDVRLDWQWKPQKYKTLDMLCQVQLEHSGHREMRNCSGLGLGSVVVSGLTPADTYTVKVRCGTVKHFWKWGDNSEDTTFQTKGDIPEALDVWMHTEKKQTVIAWNTLLANQSHGHILDYEVIWGKSVDHSRERRTVHPSSKSGPNYYTLPFVASGEEYVVTVTARNLHGSSPPSSVTLPSRFPDGMVTTKVFGREGGFDLTWNASLSASHGYVVDWCPTSGTCSMEWVKVPAGVTRTRIQSANLEGCVRYTISIYACTSRAPELLDRREGYVKECIPEDTFAMLNTSLSDSHVSVTWIDIPPEQQTAFIHRYILTYSDDTGTIINISTANATENSLTVSLKDLHRKSYQFTLKALTSVGTTNGRNFYVNLKTDQPIWVMLLFLGAIFLFVSLATIICYRNRQWLKREIYPDIPQPALKTDWLTTLKGYGVQVLHDELCQSSQLDILPVMVSHNQEEEKAIRSRHLPRTTAEVSSSSSESRYGGVDFANPSYNSFVFPVAEMELCEDYHPHTGPLLSPNPPEVSARGHLVFPEAEMELCKDYHPHTGPLLSPSPLEVSAGGD
ncbi:leukemia inhibitory factor receptor-like isoform X2 [Hypomesus transpacificus]|nr:leukemia inhibitory factor receptor-like isoform X2 [Hypomesus transpacificus]XP_046900982.1 leukemia inhibitory factor receptor-like isoform X2 [Hypomesus transpacificus]XP_046900983.1 leukemia inhibitory factor receptor-like isoform X2 [Hypomesus transpacificus]